MPTKSINVSASVATRSVQFSVTAPAGGAGALLPYESYTSAITLANVSLGAGFEYSLNGGTWQFVGAGCHAVIPADASRDKVRLRLINDGSTTVPIEATVDGPVLSTANNVTTPFQADMAGHRVVLVGDSNTLKNFELPNIVSASRTNGIVSVVLQSAPFYLYPGAPVYVIGVPDDMAFNQTILTANDATKTYTYANPGPDTGSVSFTGTPSLANLSRQMDDGYFTWINALSGYKFDFVGISAQIGRTSGEVAARIGEVTPIPAEYAMHMDGTNDLMGNRTAASIIDNNIITYEALRASGKKLVALSILPLGSGNGAWSAERTATALEVNAWRREYCRTHAGCQYLDVWSVAVDPVSTNKGQALAGMIRANDGLHTTQRLAKAIGVLGAAEFSSIPRAEFRITSNADNYVFSPRCQNIVVDGFWTTSGGTPSTLGAGLSSQTLTGTPAVTWIMIAREDGVGYDAKGDITINAAGDQIRLKNTDNTIPLARIPAGSTVQLDISIKITGNAGGKLRSLAFYLNQLVGGQFASVAAMAAGAGSGVECVQDDWEGVLRSLPITLPFAITSNPSWRLDITGGVPGTVTVQVGRLQINVLRP